MTTKPRAKVYRADLYGLRKGKYDYLWENDVSTTEWEEVKPQTPFYLFIPQNRELLPEYESGWKITEAMPFNNRGFSTSRDAFVVDFDEVSVLERIRTFAELPVDVSRKRFKLRDVREKTLEQSRSLVKEIPNLRDYIRSCSYRPFDSRTIFYHNSLVRWPVLDTMYHMMTPEENLAICFIRRSRTQNIASFFVSTEIVDKTILSSADNANLAPLYLYPTESSNDLFSQPTANPGGRRPNLSPDFIEDVATRLGLSFVDDGKGDLENTFGPEDIFHYNYAVFHSPIYRERYAEFLKIDFPRVPLTSNIDLFRSLVAKGETLTSLHLMERVGSVMTSYPVEGDNVVEKPSFKEDEGGLAGRVYINTTQYFDGVPVEVWNFYVGGYQVLHKWLKDRKGRELSF